jgi:hypothetical protein
MKRIKKAWLSENENNIHTLTKDFVKAEIDRIKKMRLSSMDKLSKIRQLVDSYFMTDSNEELLNANLPFIQ